jgi:hypothetical protein
MIEKKVEKESKTRVSKFEQFNEKSSNFEQTNQGKTSNYDLSTSSTTSNFEQSNTKISNIYDRTGTANAKEEPNLDGSLFSEQRIREEHRRIAQVSIL